MKSLGLFNALFRNFGSSPFTCCSNMPPLLACCLVLVSLCLIFAGCANLKVKQPTSDSTPPILELNVFNHNTGQQNDYPMTEAPKITIRRGERYRITLKAKDPQGVKSIAMNQTFYEDLNFAERGMKWVCVNTGQIQQEKYYWEPFQGMIQNLSPDQDGMVLTTIFLILDTTFPMPCPNGYAFDTERSIAVMKAQACNYFGGISEQDIEFQFVFP